jgi:antitoxin ParD1/3/4
LLPFTNKRYLGMANVSKISVALTPEMAELVRQAVESGEYASGSEVIREALREWKLRRNLRQHEREELQKMWAEGLASGPGRLGSMRAIKQEARRRLTADAPPDRK